MDLEFLKQSLPDLHSAALSDKSLEDLQHDRILNKYAQRFQIFVRDFHDYKFRPHAVHHLMGGLPKPLTNNQAETLEAYQLKIDSGKTLTAKQYEDYGSLLAKKNAKPVLSAGAKNYLKDIFKEITFQRSKELKNKYLDKGLICEADSIAEIQTYYGLDCCKNNERFENEHFSGEPDIVLHDEVIDIKSSWDYETFPMFDDELENKAYYWQIQAYMDLLKLQKGRVIFVLNDTPEQIIYEEKRRISWQLGLIDESMSFDLPEDLEFEIERNLRYDDIPPEARIKEFVVQRDEKDIQLMHHMILLARKYLTELKNSLEKRFVNHL